MPKQSGCFANSLRVSTWTLVVVLFAGFHQQLVAQGYIGRTGRMIDATFIEIPRQHMHREENARFNSGEAPEAWNKPEAKAKRRLKDIEACRTKKNEEKHYRYKNHSNADKQHKLIQSYSVTSASIHNSQAFDELFGQTRDTDGIKRTVYVDSS